MISLNKQRGFLTIVTVTLIVVMGMLAVAMAYVFSNSAFTTTNFQAASEALYLADSGLEQEIRALLLPTVASRDACGGASLTNSIGNGTFTVTAAGPFAAPSPSATLTSAITNSVTTIPVSSTTGYQSAGRIMIDNELINYTAVNSTNFLNATRGVDSSTAAAHASGTPIGQYQCNLSSSGGSPTLSPANPGDPGGIRRVNESIQLQEAWAVGNKPSTSNFNYVHWNNPTEVAWTNASVASASAVNLNGISMLSYEDGWAVGANRTFSHWNGSTWTSQLPAAIPNVTMNSVFCNASNDCHAVGIRSGNAPVFARWNGASWSLLTPSNPQKNDMNSIHCDASNDCWAVGTNQGNTFYNWNGASWVGVVVGSLTGFTFNDVFCNTSTDCWAVGANNTFARKNGATWTNANATEKGTIPSARYNGIYCVSPSDCWAVGNSNSGADLFVHWNGTSWSRDDSTPTPVVNLQAVACANTNDCWAVGAASSSKGTFFHWDGTSWTNFAVSGILNAQLNHLSVISPGSKPWSVWSENFS